MMRQNTVQKCDAITGPADRLHETGGIMREWCHCGSAIRARRRDVLQWRTNHACPGRTEPDNDAHISASAHVEHAGDRYFDGGTPIVQARIGFQPGGQR